MDQQPGLFQIVSGGGFQPLSQQNVPTLSTARSFISASESNAVLDVLVVYGCHAAVFVEYGHVGGASLCSVSETVHRLMVVHPTTELERQQLQPTILFVGEVLLRDHYQ